MALGDLGILGTLGTMRPAARQKAIKASVELLRPGTRVREVGMGYRSFIMTQGIRVAVCAFAAVMILVTLVGYFGLAFVALVPLVVYSLLTGMPWRTVYVADQGVALVARNLLTGEVAEVLHLLALEAMSPQNATVQGKSKLVLTLGNEKVTFTQSEFDRLSEAAHAAWLRRYGDEQQRDSGELAG